MSRFDSALLSALSRPPFPQKRMILACCLFALASCAGKSADRELPDREIPNESAQLPKGQPTDQAKAPKVVSPLERFRQDEVAFAGGEFACVSDADATKLESELKIQKVPQEALRIRVMQGPEEALLCQAIKLHTPLFAPLYRRIERPARWRTAPFKEGDKGTFERLAAEIRLKSPSATLGLPRIIVFGETDLRSAVPSR